MFRTAGYIDCLRERRMSMKKKTLKTRWKEAPRAARILIPAALLVLAGAAAFAVYASSAVQAGYTPVTAEHVEDWYRENGVLSLGEDYAQISRVGGEIKEVCVRENQRVSAGDLLFVIDPEDYVYQRDITAAELDGLHAQLDAARIGEVMTASPAEYLASIRKQYESAQAALDAAATVWNADQALYAAGDISRIQYEADKSAYEAAAAALETARTRYEESSRRHAELAADLAAEASEDADADGSSAVSLDDRFFESEEAQLKARIDAGEAALKQLQDRIARCEVRADRSGIIKSLDVKGLSSVSEGSVLCTISDRSEERLCAECDILTSAAAYLAPGTPVQARLKQRGSETVLSGRVTEVYDYAQKDLSALGLEEYRVHVKAELDPAAGSPQVSDTGNLDGYGAELSFCLYQADALTLPVSAVFQEDHRYFVYVNEGGRASVRPISVSYSTGSKVIVSGGLEEGDLVIDGISRDDLYEGVRVR